MRKSRRACAACEFGGRADESLPNDCRWCLSMHWEMRRRFEAIMQASPELPLRRRFTRPADVDAWVAELEQQVAAKRKVA